MLKLGKHPATVDERDLKLATYLDVTKLPKVPSRFGHEDKMPSPRLMLGNGPDDSVAPGFDGAGDCVFAMICNAVRLANGIAGHHVNFTGKEAIAAYSKVTGYRIGDEDTDNGTNLRTALNWWRKTGIKDADGKVHKLAAFATINLKGTNLTQLLQACYTFDIGVAVGIMFPDTAMDQFNAGKPWDVVPGTPEPNEGHAILFDARRKYHKVESWARDQDATAPFLATYVDEAYALFSEEALVKGKSLEGFNVSQLEADLKAL